MAEVGLLAIAHRAGNTLAGLRAAEDMGADYIELDAWPFRGRLEVRHWKTIGPLPIYWERWKLAPCGLTFPTAGEVIAASRPGTKLLFDLKGGSRSAARELAALLRDRPHPGAYAVCSQWWGMLEPFAGEPGASRWYSAGSRRALGRLRRFAPGVADGFSVHAKLLDAEIARALRGLAPVLASWPVHDEATLERLRALGVNGFISESPAVIARIVRERGQAGQSA